MQKRVAQHGNQAARFAQYRVGMPNGQWRLRSLDSAIGDAVSMRLERPLSGGPAVPAAKGAL